MNDEQQFIIEDPTSNETKTVVVKKFWILPHLLVLGLILFGLFSAVIIPKTTAILQSASTNSTAAKHEADKSPEKETRLVSLEPQPIRAGSAIILDAVNGEILYEKSADDVLPLASITKLMTALVAYEVLEDDTQVTVSRAAAAQQSGGTLRAGEIFSVKDLADFSLVSSFNSAAYTLADSVGRLLGEGNPQLQFVTAMNIRAEELKLNSLKFNNATGLDISATESGGYGNARDTALLVKYILDEHPNMLTPTITDRTRLYNNEGEFHEARNTNDIINNLPNVIGSKTGYTDLAGGNLVMAYNAGLNRPIIMVVLDSTRTGRFEDMLKLHEAVRIYLSQNSSD